MGNGKSKKERATGQFTCFSCASARLFSAACLMNHAGEGAKLKLARNLSAKVFEEKKYIKLIEGNNSKSSSNNKHPPSCSTCVRIVQSFNLTAAATSWSRGIWPPPLLCGKTGIATAAIVRESCAIFFFSLSLFLLLSHFLSKIRQQHKPANELTNELANKIHDFLCLCLCSYTDALMMIMMMIMMSQLSVSICQSVS